MDIVALEKTLKGKGDPLDLAAADASIGPELTGFLDSIPAKTITLSPGADGIGLSGSTLTISGSTADTWPIQGLGGSKLSLTHFEITVVDESPAPVVTGSGSGTLPLGASADADVVVVSDATGRWHVTLTKDVVGVTPNGLIALALAGPAPLQVPSQLDMDLRLTLAQGHFEVVFIPNTNFDAWLDFTVSVPQAEFVLIQDVAQLDSLTLHATVMTHSLSVALTGQLEIAHQPVNVTVGLSTDAIISAAIAAPQGETFPSIDKVADWIAGKGRSQAKEISSGFQSVGVELDAALAGVLVTFDAEHMHLVSLEIFGILTVLKLELAVTVTLPDFSVSGRLAPGAAPKLSEVLGAAGLPVGDLPTDAEITAVDFDAAPAAGRYRAVVRIDETAKAGSFGLDEISASVSHENGAFDGQLSATMTLWDIGELVTTAEYDASRGWIFSTITPPEQSLDLGKILGTLNDEFGVPKASVPAPLATLTITALQLSYATASGSFSFGCIGTFQIMDKSVAIAPAILIAPVDPTDLSKGYNHEFGGALTIGWVELALKFDSQPASTTFVAYYAEGSGGPPGVDLKDFISGLSPALGKPIPAGLTIDLKNAKVASIGATGGTRTLALAFDLSASIALSNLPLIGNKLPANLTLSLDDLQLSYASPQLTQTDAGTVNALLPQTIQFPAAGLAAGAAATAIVNLAGTTKTLSLGFGTQSTKLAAGDRAEAAGTLAGAGASAAPQATWIAVQRGFGPLHVERVGFAMTPDHEVAILLDATVSLAGLTLGLVGVEAAMPLKGPYVPNFSLAGLEVGYSAGGVVISGGLERVPNSAPPEYTGELTLDGAGFGLTLLGSYTTVDSEPSLFAFLFLDAPLGGPPFFFVTALAGGFGYNRSLQLPAVADVAKFPLVAGAMGQLDASTTRALLLDEIRTEPDENWLAAGVRFTSFETVQSFALLTVSFGAHVEIALLGESTLTLPAPRPGEANPNPVAQAQLVVLADYAPANGQIAVSAQLTPESYVLSKAARLTGGFAFYVWLAPSTHAGDFVVSLGGYHPAFARPQWYPEVPRLGLNWTVSGALTVKGSIYFAITPSVLMAGVALEATWQSGNLSAWFDAEADFLIRFKPFHYDIGVDVSIGISLTLNLLVTTKRITLRLGVHLKLWGPPFGGVARIDLFIVSFTIGFGAVESSKSQKIEWSEFRRSFLPPANDTERKSQKPAVAVAADASLSEPTKTDSLVTVHAAAGLTGTVQDDWLVDPGLLRVEVATQMPAIAATVVTAKTVALTGKWNAKVGIGPMGVAPGTLSSALEIKIERDGVLDANGWDAVATKGSVPSGLWLHTENTMAAPALVEDVLIGVTLTPSPPAAERTVTVPIKTLTGEDDPPERLFRWSTTAPAGGPALDQSNALKTLRQTLADTGTAQVRSGVLVALRRQRVTTADSVDVSRFAPAAADLLADAPLLQRLGDVSPAPGGGK